MLVLNYLAALPIYMVLILDLTNRIYISSWIALEDIKTSFEAYTAQAVIHYYLYKNMEKLDVCIALRYNQV